MSPKASLKPAKLSVALLASSTLVAIVAQLFLALPARAQAMQCEYEGQKYEPGETVGALICGEDGNWQRND